MTRLSLALALVALAASGCTVAIGGGSAPTRRDAGPSEPDAQLADASDDAGVDGAVSDASAADGSLADAGTSDAGPSDAGTSDASAVDGSLADAGADCVAPFTRFALAHAAPSASELSAWHDRGVAAASIQGIVNRDAPRLFLDALDADDTWWPRLQARLATSHPELATPDTVDTLSALYTRFACRLGGLVVWDPAVPATLNVATTIAGVEDLVVVRGDTSAGSALGELTSVAPIVVDLRGMFSGSGTLPGTSEASSGSAKNDAYRWMIHHYVETGRVDTSYAGYLLDGWFLSHPGSAASSQVPNRDFLIARRGVAFDLSNWADEVPVDDPTQPLGTDAATLQRLLGALYALHGGEGITQVMGFTPWAWKYTSYGSAGGSHAPVETEWALAELLSAYNAVLDADALGMTSLANATLYARSPLPARRVPPALTPERLRDLGVWDNRLANPGFDDDGSVSGWTAELDAYLASLDPAGAWSGHRRLAARATQPGRSLYQDVSVSVAPGQTLEGSIWARAPDGEVAPTLAIWGLSGSAENANVSATIPADGQWHRIALSFSPSHAHTQVRFQVYLRDGDPQVLLDGAALHAPHAPLGVSARHYLLWHMGDYDAAAWLYQVSPNYWDDPRRGEYPLAWAFNPNLVGRFPIAFARAWETASSRDHFSAADTVAGYVNVTELFAPRSSGLADASQAFARFARPYLRRAGTFHTVFALNGSAGAFDAQSRELLRSLVGRGVGFNTAGQPSGTPSLVGQTPFVGAASDLDRDSASSSVSRVVAATGGSAPGFHLFRSVLVSPSFIYDLTRQLHADYPGRLYTVLGPEEFFALLALQLGVTPHHRVTFVSDTLPASASAGSTLSFAVTVRNDGFDSWAAGTWRLGAHVASAEPAAGSLPSTAGAYPYRVALPHSVGPGESVTLDLSVTLPATTGAQVIQLDMVEEGVTWFETQGGLPWVHALSLR